MAELSLGQKIKAFRKRQKVSQLDLEIAINASPGSISRIENGKVNPTKETISKIATALDISARELTLLYEIFQDIPPINSIITLKDNLSSIINEEELKKRLISDLLVQLDKNEDYLASSFSKVNIDEKELRLMSISNSLISHTIQTKVFQENVFRKIIIHNSKNTLTTEAARRNKLIYNDDLTKFLSPPLSNHLVIFIQKVFNIKSMVAIPLSDNSDKCFGVINIALKKNINLLTNSDKKRFIDISRIISEIILKILNISVVSKYDLSIHPKS